MSKLSKEELAIVKAIIKIHKPNTKTTITIKKGWNVGIW